MVACSNNSIKRDSASNTSSGSTESVQENWKEYRNDKYGFSFLYDSGWTLKEQPSDQGRSYGGTALLELFSPQLSQRNANMEKKWLYIPGNFRIIYCPELDSLCATHSLGGTNFKTLEEALNNNNSGADIIDRFTYSTIKKTGKTIIDNQPGFEVFLDEIVSPNESGLGMSAIMIEHQGVYILEFPLSDTTNGIFHDPTNTAIQKILSSFKFLK